MAAFPQTAGPPRREFVLPWLRVSHEVLHEGLDLSDDDSLGDVRLTHWGEEKTRRWFITTVIEHNIYHAGEINHIRALAQGNDRW